MTTNRVSDKELLSRIDKLNSTSFENLTLDLLRAVGFRNIVWRTPGADGGRDIQAEQSVTDLTGTDTQHTWYVECKHYSSSIDWPTLWKKISYADSHGADFLLLVTNSQPSPQCETEIGRWNKEKRRPSLRVWRGYDLPMYLRLNEDVGVAHGLMQADLLTSSLSVEITSMLSKLSQAAYSSWAFSIDPELPLTSAAALSELFHQRMHDLSVYGRFISGDNICKISDWPWLNVDGDLTSQEEVGFKAIIAAVRHVLQAERLQCVIHDRLVRVDAVSSKGKFNAGSETFLKPILNLSMCDIFDIKGEFHVEFSLRGAHVGT